MGTTTDVAGFLSDGLLSDASTPLAQLNQEVQLTADAAALVADTTNAPAAQIAAIIASETAIGTQMTELLSDLQDCNEYLSFANECAVAGDLLALVGDVALLGGSILAVAPTPQTKVIGDACQEIGMFCTWAGIGINAVAKLSGTDNSYSPSLSLGMDLGNLFVPQLETQMQTAFNEAQTFDPVVIDLGGSGITPTTMSGGTHFDWNGTGFAEETGWISSGNAFLVQNVSSTSQITSGAQFITSAAQLAALDTNGDNKIDADDASWNTLSVWVNGTGTGTGQLLTLAQAGIESLNLVSGGSSVSVNGDTVMTIGSVTMTDGTTRALGDVTFATDPAVTQQLNPVTAPADVQVLPDVTGFGNVMSLQQALATEELAGGTALKTLVEQFIQASDPATRARLVNQILYQWVGVENVDPASRGGNIDARQLGVLESFLGQTYHWTNWQVHGGSSSSDPSSYLSTYLEQAYNQLYGYVYAQLMVQTHDAGLFAALGINWDTTAQQFTFDVSGMVSQQNIHRTP